MLLFGYVFILIMCISYIVPTEGGTSHIWFLQHPSCENYPAEKKPIATLAAKTIRKLEILLLLTVPCESARIVNFRNKTNVKINVFLERPRIQQNWQEL